MASVNKALTGCSRAFPNIALQTARIPEAAVSRLEPRPGSSAQWRNSIVTIGTRRLSVVAVVGSIALAACSGGTLSPSPTSAPAASQPPASEAASAPAASAPAAPASAAAISYRCTKGEGQLNGAGSTFIFPLLSKMGEDYNTKCGVKLNYQSIGSGGGIKDWQTNTVDFGATDAYLSDTDISAAAKNGEPIEVPVTFGAVVVAYNLKGLGAPLKMTPDIIAGLFLGKITIVLYWFLEVFFLSALRFAYRYFRYTRVRHRARAEDASPTLLIGRAADAEILLRGIESGAVKRIWPVGLLSPSPADPWTRRPPRSPIAS